MTAVLLTVVAAVVTAAPAVAEEGGEGGTMGGVLVATQEESTRSGPPSPARPAPRRESGRWREGSAKRAANAGLAITVPTSRALGSTTIGGQLSAQLGTVTVADTRGSAVQVSYTATVSTTNFTTTVGGNTSTISRPNISYWSGPATTVSGTGVFTPGQLTAANAIALTGTHTAFSVTLAVGNTTVAWNPTVIVRVPSSAVAGSYSGTITHSVA
ncbi:hypothetical protein GT755_17440 [Herbidospora sp. NEAU-GS84]|uniref:WxL domain-containing protein n=1 Tax=Herbidospora solisilvae TaxID=2696284 RepID=A0A7C9N131_9ACTN|nr:hypothetical protein [Herbidospora solisilvae]NAS23470.1 hypothetical protein [Herbidospora solisilvae]